MTRRIDRVVRAAIARSYERLVGNQQRLFEGRDPEAVHQARVATRRLRSDLRTFRSFLDESWSKAVRSELRWLGANLGAVRDVEVLLGRLETHAAQLAPGEADAVARILRRLKAERTAARAALLSSLRASRYAELRWSIAAAGTAPPLTTRARSGGRKALRRVVRRRWRQLQRSVRRLGDPPSDEALHGVRKRAKQCRYAAEACAPVFGADARRFARAMTRLQDNLGEHHDAVVAIAWLGKTAPECSPGEAFALGRLAEIEHRAAAGARDEFRHAWKRARRRRLRAWM